MSVLSERPPATAHDQKASTVSRKLYFVRGVAILLVVLGHVIGRDEAFGLLKLYHNELPLLAGVKGFIYSFHVPLLFICSGVSMALFSRANSSLGQFALSRFTRIVVPVLCWAPIAYVLRAWSNRLSFTWQELFWTAWFERFDIFWFFHALLFASCFCFVLMKVLPDGMSCFAASLLAVLAVAGLQHWFAQPWLAELLYYLQWNLAYAFGLGIALYLEPVAAKLARVPVSRLWILGAGLAGLMLVGWLAMPGQWLAVTKFANGCLAFALLMLLPASSRKLPARFYEWCMYLGRVSMAIYLFHVYFLGGVRILIEQLLGTTLLVLPLQLVAGFTVGLLVPVYLYEFFKPRSKLFVLSLGEGR